MHFVYSEVLMRNLHYNLYFFPSILFTIISIRTAHFISVMRCRRFGRLNGSMIGELRTMKHEAPELLYTMLRDERFSLVDILKLNIAFKQISWWSATRSPFPRPNIRGEEGQFPPCQKFWAVGKLSENLFLVRKVLFIWSWKPSFLGNLVSKLKFRARIAYGSLRPPISSIGILYPTILHFLSICWVWLGRCFGSL